MIAINPAMRFGKHKGTLVSEVPTQYLTWVMETFPRPPDYVVAEVVRRGSTQFGGDAILCQAAISDRAFDSARGGRKKWRRKPPRGASNPRRAAKRAARGEVARQKAKESESRMAKGVWIVGENFERLRHEFIASGGDVDSCPFEAPDNADFLDHLYSITHS
jgi:hypothetical protein